MAAVIVSLLDAITGDVDEAIEQFRRSLTIDSDSALTHNSLGAALLELGEVSAAIDHFESAIRNSPQFARAHFNLGVAQQKLGRKAAAMAHFLRAQSLVERGSLRRA